jgi:hypothetical protein
MARQPFTREQFLVGLALMDRSDALLLTRKMTQAGPAVTAQLLNLGAI